MINGYSTQQQQHQQMQLNSWLQQRIRLLQLSSAELGSLMIEESERNPLLELSWNDTYTSSGGYSTGHESELPAAADTIQQSGDSLELMLLSQLRLIRDQEDLVGIVQYMIGNLDERGYLSVSMQHICEQLSISEQQADQALELLHTMEPVGVGARSLSECLLLQIPLDAEQEKQVKARLIIQHYLQEVAQGKLKWVAQQLSCPVDDVLAALAYVRTLNPRPGAAYFVNESVYIQPDATLVRMHEDSAYKIIMRQSHMPTLSIHPAYATIPEQGYDKNTTQYVRQQLQSAKELLQHLEFRKHTLQRLIHCIVREQLEFFEHGAGHLRPLTMKDVARALDVSESTISRAVKDKYLATPQGTYALKYFFSSGLPTEDAAVAATGVKQRIKQLISLEDKSSPLSDQQIADRLATEGIQLSRRTVMKYREELRILSSRQRMRAEYR